MKSIDSIEILEQSLKSSRMAILYFANKNNPACVRTGRVLEEIEEKYLGRVDFYSLDAVRVYDLMVRFQVPSIPSVVILVPDPYGSDTMLKKACITEQAINKDNMIGLISEYGSWNLK